MLNLLAASFWRVLTRRPALPGRLEASSLRRPLQAEATASRVLSRDAPVFDHVPMSRSNRRPVAGSTQLNPSSHRQHSLHSLPPLSCLIALYTTHRVPTAVPACPGLVSSHPLRNSRSAWQLASDRLARHQILHDIDRDDRAIRGHAGDAFALSPPYRTANAHPASRVLPVPCSLRRAMDDTRLDQQRLTNNGPLDPGR